MSDNDKINFKSINDLDLDAKQASKFELEAAPTELPENYLRSELMFVPDVARQLYKEKGYDLQWVRIKEPGSTDALDSVNIQKKSTQGYSFVKREEVPGLDEEIISVFGDAVTDSRGLYIIGDSALAKIPLSFIEASKKKKAEVIRQRTESVKSDLRKNQVAPSAAHGEEFDLGDTREVSLGE